MRKRDTLTPQQAADICGVDRTTMRRWLMDGMIPHSVTPGGWRRIAKNDLVEFMQDHAIPIPDWLDPGPGRVLLVDDDPKLTAATRRLLRRIDRTLEVVEVHDGFGAGVAALTLRPHVMVLDLVMPGMDGFEVCRWFMTEPRLSSVAVVMLSGHLGRYDTDALLTMGAKACLHKPVRPAQLLEAIAPWLPKGDGHRRAPSPVGSLGAPRPRGTAMSTVP